MERPHRGFGSSTRRLRQACLATLAVALGCLASPAPIKTVKLAHDFILKVGESALIEGEALEVGFVEVAADSRCPKDARCVWEGDAVLTLCLRKAGAPKRVIELHTSSKEKDSPNDSGYQVTLLGLDPKPVSSGGNAQADYVATLRIDRGSAPSTSDR
jgi:hypothetical protein